MQLGYISLRNILSELTGLHNNKSTGSSRDPSGIWMIIGEVKNVFKVNLLMYLLPY